MNSEEVFLRLSTLAVEYWKLAASFERAIASMPEQNSKRFASQLRFSRIQLDGIASECGLKLVSFDGEDFHAGLPASGDNLSDFDENDDLVVFKTLEPAVIKDMAVISKGRVLVASKGTE